MELDLDVRSVGRPGKVLNVELVRELEEGDLPALALPRPTGRPSVIKRLSERHHALARTLASGASERDAAIICGYDISRVSILKNDPTFQELLAFYRSQVEVAFIGTHEKLATISSTALTLLQDQLEDEPENFSVNQLIELVKTGADRTGFGPQTKSDNINVNLNTATRLEEARKRIAERRGASHE